MTKQHPLTDKICESLVKEFVSIDPDDMRAAADWQLEQVIRWIEKNLDSYTDHSYLGDCHPLHRLDTDLKEAMRLTQGDS